MSVSASKWDVFVTNPDTGHTHNPEVLSDPVYTPSINDIPEIEIPVHRDEKWRREWADRAQMEVYKNGVRLPIGELSNVEVEPERSILIGRGGTELLDRVVDEFEYTKVTDAVTTILGNTSYTATVDAFPESVFSETIRDLTTTAELESYLLFPDNDEYEARNGNVEALQSLHFGDSEDIFDAGGTPAYFGSGQTGAVDESAWEMLSSGDRIEFQNITVERDMGITSDLGVALRIQGSANGTDVDIDGNVVQSYTGLNGPAAPDWSWVQITGIATPNLTVSGNDHTVGIELTESPDDGGGESLKVDCIVVYDDQFSYTFPSTTDGNNQIAGPELYPDEIEVTGGFDPSIPYFYSRIDVDTEWDDSTAQQGIEVNTGIANTGKLTNTEDYVDNNPGLAYTVNVNFYFGRYGTQVNDSPTQGINGQKLQSLNITVDKTDVPIISHLRIDGQIRDILTKLAKQARFVWEYRVDGDGNGEVVWTTVGQRSSSTEPKIEDYNVSRKSGSVVKTAVIYGSRSTIQGESVTANHGSFVGLNQDVIIEGTETIEDGGGTVYIEGTTNDYVMDYENGQIKTLSGGNISDGASLTATYEYKTRGSFTDPDLTDGQTIVREVPELPTEVSCRRAALQLVNRLNVPQEAATIRIPNSLTQFSVVEDLSSDILPTGGSAVHIRDVRQEEGDTVILAESRKSIDEEVRDLRSRLSLVSRRS